MEKRKLTAAELSAIRANAGRKGATALKKSGNYRGGRPAGMMPDTDPCTCVRLHATDKKYLARMSISLGISIAACIRTLICQYRETHPELKCADAEEARLNQSRIDFGQFITAKN